MPQFAQGLRHTEYAYYYKVIVTWVNQFSHKYVSTAPSRAVAWLLID